jgi:hypothetical protein
LLDLPKQVPDVGEREFLDEALKCFRASAFRAAIIMSWNLAYDHLLSFVLQHHLAAFNAQWPRSFSKQNAQARVQAITARDHFAELKESEVLNICKAAGIISPDIWKIMDEKLGKRNSAAHPSGVVIGPPQAENFIHEIVNNVVLKFVI